MKRIAQIAGVVGFVLLAANNLVAQQTNFKFLPGNGKVPKGYLQVSPGSVYSKETGYGLDLGSAATVVATGSRNPLQSSYLTADKPFFFSVNVPEGNYKVTLTIGGAKETSELTVKAESRRLMLEKIVTPPGKFITKTFVVNIRRPEISTGGKVSLKERELGKLDWDDKLTLEFNGTKPCISSIEVAKVEDLVTVYLAGNSTVVDQEAEPWASWGQMITRFFKPGVAIANHAESGLTLASFKSQHRLEKVLSLIKPGDFLFIEFGHNDQKMSGADDGAWKSYINNFKYFIDEVKKKKAYAVVVTSTSRRRFDDSGRTINTLGDFPAAARKIAESEQVPVIDLNSMTTALYDALGVKKSMKAFVHYPANTFPGQDKALADNTHFNTYGAYELAKCIIEGIRINHLNIEKFVIDAPHFDPSHPDALDSFKLVMTPGTELTKPDGN